MQDAHDTLVHFSAEQLACKERKSLLGHIKQLLTWLALRYNKPHLNSTGLVGTQLNYSKLNHKLPCNKVRRSES